MHESAHADSASYVPVPGVKLSTVRSNSVLILEEPRAMLMT